MERVGEPVRGDVRQARGDVRDELELVVEAIQAAKDVLNERDVDSRRDVPRVEILDVVNQWEAKLLRGCQRRAARTAGAAPAPAGGGNKRGHDQRKGYPTMFHPHLPAGFPTRTKSVPSKAAKAGIVASHRHAGHHPLA